MGIVRDLYYARKMSAGLKLPAPTVALLIKRLRLAAAMGGGVTKTVSGAPAHITDALAKAALSVLATISPVQDLHGYANPWPGGGGVNLLPNALPAGTINAAINSSGYISSATNTRVFAIPCKANTDYTFQQNATSSAWTTIGFSTAVPAVGNTIDRRGNMTNRASWTLNSGNNTYLVMEFTNTSGFDNVVTTREGMVFEGTGSKSYSPYENICPITGMTSAKIYRFGKNLFNKNGVSSTAVTITQNSSGFRIVSNANGTYKTCYGGFPFQTLDFPDGTEVTFSAHCKVNSGKARLGVQRVSDNNLVAYSSLVSSGEADLSLTYTYDKSIPVYLSMFCTWDTSEAGDVEYTNIQLEIGSTVTSYEPFAGTTYTVDWTSVAGTIYKGSFDSVLGPLTKTQRSFDFQGVTPTSVSVLGEMTRFWLYDVHALANGNMLCNMAPVVNNTYYASDEIGVTYMSAYPNSIAVKLPKSLVGTTVDSIRSFLQTGAFQMVQDLVTPVEYQLTAQEVQMLLGENYVWSSSGDTVSVTYYAEGNANPLQSLNILLGGRYSNPKTADDVSDKEALDIILGGNK